VLPLEAQGNRKNLPQSLKRNQVVEIRLRVSIDVWATAFFTDQMLGGMIKRFLFVF
jgi:hypothetical protein